MSESAKAPIIAGMAVGIIFIVVIVSMENSLAYTSLHTQPLDMFLVVDGREYYGEKGSFCTSNGCADVGFSMPSELVVIEKGSEVSVRVAGYLQPSELYWVLANGLDEEGNFSQQQEMIAKRLNSTRFVIDLREGEYILNVQAIWTSYTDVGNASYNYHISVI